MTLPAQRASNAENVSIWWRHRNEPGRLSHYGIHALCFHEYESAHNSGWGFNLLGPGTFEWNFRKVIFKLIMMAPPLSRELPSDDKSTSVQVMTWARQATSHNPRQCWPRSMSPYGATRPQWVNTSGANPASNHSRINDDLMPSHDDVIKWKHFPRYWPFVRGIHRSPVISPHKGQWRGALMFSLICAWINGWVNNREAGDLRRYHAHYGVIVMCDNRNKLQPNLNRNTIVVHKMYLKMSSAKSWPFCPALMF